MSELPIHLVVRRSWICGSPFGDPVPGRLALINAHIANLGKPAVWRISEWGETSTNREYRIGGIPPWGVWQEMVVRSAEPPGGRGRMHDSLYDALIPIAGGDEVIQILSRLCAPSISSPESAHLLDRDEQQRIARLIQRMSLRKSARDAKEAKQAAKEAAKQAEEAEQNRFILRSHSDRFDRIV